MNTIQNSKELIKERINKLTGINISILGAFFLFFSFIILYFWKLDSTLKQFYINLSLVVVSFLLISMIFTKKYNSRITQLVVFLFYMFCFGNHNFVISTDLIFLVFISFISVFIIEYEKYYFLILCVGLGEYLNNYYFFSFFVGIVLFSIYKILIEKKKKLSIYLAISAVVQLGIFIARLVLSKGETGNRVENFSFLFGIPDFELAISIGAIVFGCFFLACIDKVLGWVSFGSFVVLIICKAALIDSEIVWYSMMFIPTIAVLIICSNQNNVRSFFRENSQNIEVKTLKRLLLTIFVLLIFSKAWISDDAYHGFAMIRNFGKGNGLVYNVGERVNAATNPLLMIILSLICLVFRDIELTTIAVEILLCVFTVVVVNRHLQSRKSVFIFALLLMASYSYIAFTTSGLENCLICLCEMLYFVFVLNHDEKYNAKELLWVSFLCSLSILTRFDTALLLFLPTAYIFLFRRNCGFFKMIGAGLLGLLPFFSWIAFSVIYYGYPFPNTFYMKVKTGIPIQQYFAKGLNYYGVTFFYDAMSIVTIFIALVLMIKCSKNILSKLIFGSVIVKLVYFIYVGGDFMMGRYFCDLFIISLYYILWLNENKLIKMINLKRIIVVLLCFTMIGNFNYSFLFDKFAYPFNDVAFEREGYIAYTSVFEIIYSRVCNVDVPLLRWEADEIEDSISNGYKGDVVYWAPGILCYKYNDVIRLTGRDGLADPLLIFMPIDWGYSGTFIQNGSWRIGHMQRIVPEGYPESVRYDQNLVVDEETHELYDKVRIVVKGELFSKERFKTILELNKKLHEQ